MEEPIIRIIPKTVKVKIDEATGTVAKTRVAAYCRVSSDKDDQLNSLENQKMEFEKKIKEKPEWEFVNLYYDEGITGTCLTKRKGFNMMINDAHSGKIDLILVKSISRFARNTVDFLKTIRELKEINVGVMFEKERFYSLDDKNETMLSIFATLAQDESRQISTNVTWGVKARMRAGTYQSYSRNYLGYRFTKDKTLIVEPEEADTVKKIFSLFLSGYTYREIVKKLTDLGKKNFKGEVKWSVGQINRILSNEKYTGDLLYQKTFTKDYLTHQSVKNTGQVEQYVVENHHERIIDKCCFDAVQTMRKLKTENLNPVIDQSKTMALAGMVYCACCGRNMHRIKYKMGKEKTKIVLTCKKQEKEKKGFTNCEAKNTLDYDLVLMAVNSVVENAFESGELNLLLESINQAIDIDKTYGIKNDLIKQKDLLTKEQEDLVTNQVKRNIPIDSFKEQYEVLRKKIDDIEKKLVVLNDDILKTMQNKTFIRDLTEFLQKNNSITPRIVLTAIKRIYRLKDNSILIIPNKPCFSNFGLEELRFKEHLIEKLPINICSKDGKELIYRILKEDIL